MLAHLCSEVYSIEIIEPLVVGAAESLGALGITNIHLRAGDGFEGWPEAAPFDGIVVSAAARSVPPPLLAQLARGGTLIIPVGELDTTWMTVVRKSMSGELSQEKTFAVRFVPLTGPHTRGGAEPD